MTELIKVELYIHGRQSGMCGIKYLLLNICGLSLCALQLVD